MEFLLNRYRNLSVLLLAILAQLVLLAYQVKSNSEVRLIRVWAVTAVTPLARVIETGRSGVSHFFSDYFVLLDVREENKRLKEELDRSADGQSVSATRARHRGSRQVARDFPVQSPSKTVAAHIIGNTTDTGRQGGDRRSRLHQRRSERHGGDHAGGNRRQGERASIRLASFVLLITDPTFAAGVISQKNHVHGTLKGPGQQHGDRRLRAERRESRAGRMVLHLRRRSDFPQGPAGRAGDRGAPGKTRKEIYVTPSGFQNGLEEVLIVIEGVHAPIPEAPPASQPVHLLAAAPPDDGAARVRRLPAQNGPLVRRGPRWCDQYRKIGEAENHVYGERGNWRAELQPHAGRDRAQSARRRNPPDRTGSPPASPPNP